MKLLFHSERPTVPCSVTLIESNSANITSTPRPLFHISIRNCLPSTKRAASSRVHLKESRFMNILSCRFSSVIIKNIAAKCFVAFKFMTTKMGSALRDYILLSLAKRSAWWNKFQKQLSLQLKPTAVKRERFFVERELNDLYHSLARPSVCLNTFQASISVWRKRYLPKLINFLGKYPIKNATAQNTYLCNFIMR